MSLIKIYLSFLQLARGFQISWIIFKHAAVELWDHTRFGRRRLCRKDGKVYKPVYTTPQRIRQTIEELGPTYIKFGQILADRPDMVSEKFRVELKRLQSRVVPFDTRLAIQLIEKQLGRSLDDVFDEFDNVPIAAASIGQVYRGRLKGGEKVVVKIQRPFIENKIKMDVYLMKYLAKRLARNYPELAAFDIVGLIDEFSENIMRELDYTIEGANIFHFMKMFRDDPTVYIPKVYTEYTTRYLLVMEEVGGVTPDSPRALEEAGLDPHAVVENGANAIFKMILRYGFFHADPHPGNLFVMPGNVVAFIDFGMVGVLRPRDMNFLADFSIGFSKSDADTIAKALLVLCDKRFFEHEDDMRFDIAQMLMQYTTDDMMQIGNFSRILQQSVDIIVKYSMQIPSSIFMLMKVMATLEKFTENLYPDLSLSPIVLPYAEAVVEKKYCPRRLAHELYETAVSYVRFVQELPRDVTEILYKLKEGTIRHDIRLRDDDRLLGALRTISLRLAYALLLMGLFVGSTILIVWASDQRFGRFILYTSSVLILFLLLKWVFFHRKQ